MYQYLLHDGADKLEGQRTELVLLQKVVEVLFEQLKDEARVVLMLETLVGPDKVKLVGVLLAQPLQNVYFNLTLTGVRRVVLEDLDSHHFVGSLLPAFYHLAKCTATEKLEHFVLVAQRT